MHPGWRQTPPRLQVRLRDAAKTRREGGLRTEPLALPGALSRCSPIPGHTDPPSVMAAGHQLVPSRPAPMHGSLPQLCPTAPSLSSTLVSGWWAPLREPPKGTKFLHHYPLPRPGLLPSRVQDSRSKWVTCIVFVSLGLSQAWASLTVSSAPVCPACSTMPTRVPGEWPALPSWTTGTEHEGRGKFLQAGAARKASQRDGSCVWPRTRPSVGGEGGYDTGQGEREMKALPSGW